MKIRENNPPRAFEVGWDKKFFMKDCAHIELAADEQVTFKTEAGAEYDVARKDWGFYATPSTNGRLKKFGLRTALVKNRIGQCFVLLVEKGKESSFDAYVASETLEILGWLDEEETLKRLEKGMKKQ